MNPVRYTRRPRLYTAWCRKPAAQTSRTTSCCHQPILPLSSGDNVIATQPHAANKCTVTDLSSWLKVLNVYTAVILAHYPARTSAMLAYLEIICDASTKAKYDSHFHTLAAADTNLWWDQKASDLWHEYFTLTSPPVPPPTSSLHPATTASLKTVKAWVSQNKYIRCICFHPTAMQLCIVSGNEIADQKSAACIFITFGHTHYFL